MMVMITIPNHPDDPVIKTIFDALDSDNNVISLSLLVSFDDDIIDHENH
jgi:hypothetical protein